MKKEKNDFIVYRKTKEYISKYNYADFKGKDKKKSKRMIIQNKFNFINNKKN